MPDADLADSVVLVTGSTDGIGRAAAVRFAERGATVLLTGRSREKGERALAAVRAASDPADGRLYLADFADRAAVWDLARRVRESHDRLDVLVNNAGTWQDRRRTADGWGEDVEYTFAVNHLAPFLLTNLLVPPLRAGAPSRVVTVSSALHGRADLDLQEAVARPEYDGRAAYADSKLANVLFTYELADRLDGTGVAAHALHPGTIPSTSLARDSTGFSSVVWSLMRLLPMTASPADGARTVEYAATSPDLDGATGLYVVDRGTRRSAPRSYDEALQADCWQFSADLAGVPEAVPDVDPL